MTPFQLNDPCIRRGPEKVSNAKYAFFLLVGTLSIDIPTIGDKIVETFFLNRVISENKRIRTPPLSPPFKVGVFVVFYRQLEQGHNIAQSGWGRKAIFPPFEVNKTLKDPVLGEVSHLILLPIVVLKYVGIPEYYLPSSHLSFPFLICHTPFLPSRTCDFALPFPETVGDKGGYK